MNEYLIAFLIIVQVALISLGCYQLQSPIPWVHFVGIFNIIISGVGIIINLNTLFK